MLLNEIIQDAIQVRIAYFLQIIVNPGIGLVDLYDAVQVDWSTYDHGITIRIIDGFLKVLELLFTVTHSRQQGSDIWIDFEGFGQFSNCIWPWINKFSSAVFL